MPAHASNRAPEQATAELCATQPPHSQPRAKRLSNPSIASAAALLRLACEATSCSQAELAACLGVSTSLGQQLVEGTARLGLDHLLMLREAKPALYAELMRLLAALDEPRPAAPIDRLVIAAGARVGDVQHVVLEALAGDDRIDDGEARKIQRVVAGAVRALTAVGRAT